MNRETFGFFGKLLPGSPQQRRGGTMKKFAYKMIYLILPITIFALLLTFAYAADEPTAGQQSTMGPAMQNPEASQGQQDQDQISCMGTVVAEKNWLGMTKRFVLRQDDGQQYIISKQGRGRQLQSMVGKRIEATGALEESPGNRKMIKVMEFREISEPSK